MKTALLLALIVATVVGHSFISVPMSRTNQGRSETGCRGPSCVGPCDGTVPANRGTLGRGASVNIRWPRNNHAGGFIRFAWAPTDQSNSHPAFDSRVASFYCHERGTVAGGACAPGNGGDPNGGDSVSGSNTALHCSADVAVPDWVSDGQWTLQWAWFGGAFALGDYYSCVDYTISGGNALSNSIPPPAFTGGDFANRGTNLCKTFNTDKLHDCKDEPCPNGPFQGQVQNRAPAGLTNAQPPPPVGVPPAPTPINPPVSGGQCYATPAAAKNLGAGIASTCGNNNPSLRCADNMCCSKFGYCGATPEYCVDNQGDWRVTPCSQQGGMCYRGTNQAQLNLNGAVASSGACGAGAPNTRCSDGQCCSRFGFCGVTNDHCDNNQGDWRLVSCSGTFNIAPRDAIYFNSTDVNATIFNTASQTEDPLIGNSAKVILGLLSAAAIAL